MDTFVNFGGALSRRRLLRLFAVGGVSTMALPTLLAACGSDDDSAATNTNSETPATGSTGSDATSASTSSSTSSSTPAAGSTPAAAATTTGGSGGAAPTGTVTVALGPEITDLDSTIQNGILAFDIAVHMMEPLLLRGEDLQPAPFLAEEVSHPDDTTIRIKIRDGVKFHNGDPLTVEDVVFTIQRVSGPDSKSTHAPYTKAIQSASAVDDRTVEIKLSEPDVTILGRLSLIPIVPKKVVEELGDEGFNSSPVGTGAWKFVEWKKGQGVTMEAFPDYWREQPKIKTVVFKGIPEDATRVAALQTGALDIATNVPTQFVPQLEKSNKIQLLTANSLRGFFVILNTHKPPFDDVRVRQAMNYAIDKTLITKGVLDSYGTPISQPFGPEVFGYNPDLEGYYDYDPEKAKQLLADAGHASGLELDFYGPSGRYLKDTEVEQNIAGQLEKIGIKVNLHPTEFDTLYQNYILQKVNPDADMLFWSNANNTADADYNLALNVSSTGQNLYWNTPELDAAIIEARTIIDVEERRAKYHSILKTIVEAAPWIFLYVPVDVYGVSSNLKDWKPRSDELIYLYGPSLQG